MRFIGARACRDCIVQAGISSKYIIGAGFQDTLYVLGIYSAFRRGEQKFNSKLCNVYLT